MLSSPISIIIIGLLICQLNKGQITKGQILVEILGILLGVGCCLLMEVVEDRYIGSWISFPNFGEYGMFILLGYLPGRMVRWLKYKYKPGKKFI